MWDHMVVVWVMGTMVWVLWCGPYGYGSYGCGVGYGVLLFRSYGGGVGYGIIWFRWADFEQIEKKSIVRDLK